MTNLGKIKWKTWPTHKKYWKSEISLQRAYSKEEADMDHFCTNDCGYNSNISINFQRSILNIPQYILNFWGLFVK